MLMHAIAIVRGLVGFDAAGLFRARWQFNYARGQVMEARVLRGEHVVQRAHTC